MYDYVIVGAGSAGCVLAARLSEDPETSVLLLEAGPPDVKENIHVPLGYLQLAATDVDWDYHSAPEPNCDNRRLPLPRGKVLGGSSSINAMIYIRGNRADYDSWGTPGWAWDDLFPYFLKAEDNERGASEWHGAGGPLPVSDQRSGDVITPAFVEAGVEAGLERNEDFNGAAQDGVGMYQLTQRGGLRASAAVAYLHPAMERPNLTVMPYMQVERVLFEGTRAVGVEASQLGQAQQLRAEREVILCGGTYNSPQLLMLSGVGPAEHLAMREVELLLDQPAVGENLSDHAASFGVWTTPEPESLLLALEPAALEEFTASQTGPFASNLAESAASPGSRPAPRRPTASSTSPRSTLLMRAWATRRRTASGSPLACSPRKPRLGPARLQRPEREADRPQRVLQRRGGHAADDRGGAADGGDLRPAGGEPLLRRALHCPRRRRRGRPARPRRPHHLPDLPPGRHLRDRLGGRRRAAGRGPGGNPGGRRLGDADGPARQHQCADDRDRRARCRPDQGCSAAAGGRGRRLAVPRAVSMNGPSRRATDAAVASGDSLGPVM